jgi:tRNA pseudouridine32 synthase / 23S rRNA pseudouridine746 synthase
MDREMVDLDILYYDTAVVVVNKPGGLLSVPGRGPDKQDCIVQRIRHRFPECIAQPSVHRLDMETSGLMVLALTPEAHRNLSIQFQNRMVQKQYLAILKGIVEKEQGDIKLAFRLDVAHRPYQMYDPANGKWGLTHWEKIAVDHHQTRIRFTPLTGRTHQLRVHAAHPLGLGCPIVGDRLYGDGRPGDRLQLHASSLCFQHPNQEKTLCFESRPWF